MRTSGPAEHDLKPLFRNFNRRRLQSIVALICLTVISWVELGMVQVRASTFDHTASTDKSNCAQAHSSPDGNPFPSAVDATSFSLMSTLETGIHNEELY